jgi:hypothetical protein
MGVFCADVVCNSCFHFVNLKQSIEIFKITPSIYPHFACFVNSLFEKNHSLRLLGAWSKEASRLYSSRANSRLCVLGAWSEDDTDIHRLRTVGSTLMLFLLIRAILFIRVEPKVRICGFIRRTGGRRTEGPQSARPRILSHF